MSKRASPDDRRRDLIAATVRVLAERGAAGASVRTIAAAAGVSPGLVTHHFGGVDRLVAASYDHIAAQVAAALETAVAGAGPAPRARLGAYVAANFTAPIADPALLATWLALWSLARGDAAMLARHEQHYAAFRARLEDLLGACGVAAERLRLTAIGVTALVDGLWLELCLSPDSFSADEARRIAADYLAGL
ncbi:TetR family transcriptional regulator C-terminal domain-containing protein [Sphingomonas endophytica]|uniref:AcrR family transcriptional regulator n=1 Tax=Sphingomonas endophytica TaxID=869719 RepID=A0ABR6N2U6_9SPHN|nr:TetR family transcriptional regulator C-terminal domain-containing protein [Sphingomonas endophytica]MBB5725114.1 AcrR family transcriptional regulator [Sphingomonas endophytica]